MSCLPIFDELTYAHLFLMLLVSAINGCTTSSPFFPMLFCANCYSGTRWFLKDRKASVVCFSFLTSNIVLWLWQSLKERSLPPPPVEDGSSFPMQYSLESYVHQEPLSPPGNYPIPDMGLHGADHNTLPYNFGGLSIKEKNEMLVTTRNSLELLSSILKAETEPKPIKVIHFFGCYSIRNYQSH